jgi:predicted enzyme related to lactoylglutathione lyase
MSTTEDRSSDASGTASAGRAGMNLEVLVIPVSDVDRAKEFYGSLGWRLDADRGGGEFRLIQFTPPGSGCSVQFGTNLTSAESGSAQALLLIVADIDTARDDLVRRGVEVSEVFQVPIGAGAIRTRQGRGPGRSASCSGGQAQQRSRRASTRTAPGRNRPAVVTQRGDRPRARTARSPNMPRVGHAVRQALPHPRLTVRGGTQHRPEPAVQVLRNSSGRAAGVADNKRM